MLGNKHHFPIKIVTINTYTTISYNVKLNVVYTA